MKRARQPAGYVLLAVLLITALIASLVMTYSRHALMVADSSSATLASQRAQDAADAGFAWAKQSLRADAGSATQLDLGDGRSVSVNVGSASNHLRSIGVAATIEGTSQAVQATFETYSLAGDELPELTPAAKTAVMASGLLIDVHGNKTYASTELTGILYLHNGAKLTLQDVILDGAIVSQQATGGVGGNVEIHFAGGVQIVPGATLPGCAIVAPDADLSGDGTERVQLHGAVIAKSTTLTGSGALHGEVACSGRTQIGSSFDRPGSGRAPRAWPAGLETNASGISRLSFATVDVREAEKTAIRGFAFPARRGAAAASGNQPGRGP